MTSTAAVVDAVRARLLAALPDYLPADLTADGRGDLTLIDWRSRPETLTREAMPLLFVASVGTVEDPVRVGRDRWDAALGLDVTVYDRGETYAEVQHRLVLWQDAVRDCLMADPTLGGLARRCSWRGYRNGLLDDDDTQTLDGATVEWTYFLQDVIGTTVTPPTGTELVQTVITDMRPEE